MTWKSHVAIAAAVTLPFNTAALPAAAVGAIAPDAIEYVLKGLGFYVEHRRETHYLIIPIGIIFISFLDFNNIIFWFGIGYLTHWVADALTISGVPIAPNSPHKIHFFGGYFRTGEIQEYIFSFSLLLLSILVFKSNYLMLSREDLVFNVYNISYKDLYEKKIIDEKEYKENRFKMF